MPIITSCGPIGPSARSSDPSPFSTWAASHRNRSLNTIACIRAVEVAGEIALRIASLAVLVAAPFNRRTRAATQVRAVALSGIGLAGISQPCLGSDEIHSVKALAK